MQTFVILWMPGPSWIEGTPLYCQPFIEEHADRIGRLMAEHRVVLSGPFTMGAVGSTSPVGMTVVTAMDEPDLHAWLAEDPAIAHHIATAAVYPFHIVFAADGTPRAASAVTG